MRDIKINKKNIFLFQISSTHGRTTVAKGDCDALLRSDQHLALFPVLVYPLCAPAGCVSVRPPHPWSWPLQPWQECVWLSSTVTSAVTLRRVCVVWKMTPLRTLQGIHSTWALYWNVVMTIKGGVVLPRACCTVFQIVVAAYFE